MIDLQLLNSALMAVAILVAAAIALSGAMVAAAAVSRRGQTPPGGTRRDLPQHPAPDSDDARELVLR